MSYRVTVMLRATVEVQSLTSETAKIVTQDRISRIASNHLGDVVSVTWDVGEPQKVQR